jgi:hypothetical protein
MVRQHLCRRHAASTCAKSVGDPATSATGRGASGDASFRQRPRLGSTLTGGGVNGSGGEGAPGLASGAVKLGGFDGSGIPVGGIERALGVLAVGATAPGDGAETVELECCGAGVCGAGEVRLALMASHTAAPPTMIAVTIK